MPALNIWSNLYLNFRIARVLSVNFGADVRYFTEYNAPEYVPQLAQYAVQENSEVKTKVGNYPIVDVYCNFKLKQCRFFVMMSHVNAGMGLPKYFLTPHYPLNERVLRLGLSWNFFNWYTKMKDSVLILSGGMDSTTMLYEYKESIAIAVSFDYGSKHNAKELQCASYHCERLGINHMRNNKE